MTIRRRAAVAVAALTAVPVSLMLVDSAEPEPTAISGEGVRSPGRPHFARTRPRRFPVTTTTTVPPPPPPPPTTTTTEIPQTAPVAATGDRFDALAQCESGGDPRAVSPSGRYRGAFQFSLATWHSIGRSGDPIHHSYAAQKAAAIDLQARSGWGQWPACAAALGYL